MYQTNCDMCGIKVETCECRPYPGQQEAARVGDLIVCQPCVAKRAWETPQPMGNHRFQVISRATGEPILGFYSDTENHVHFLMSTIKHLFPGRYRIAPLDESWRCV
jgi:hypothetical protein